MKDKNEYFCEDCKIKVPWNQFPFDEQGCPTCKCGKFTFLIVAEFNTEEEAIKQARIYNNSIN